MRPSIRLICAIPLILLIAMPALRGLSAGALEIYFIDVEGGAATLVVTPARQAVLIDGGWSSYDHRDARRVLEAAADAGVERLAFAVATHLHGDHIGAIPEIARRIPVETFVDYGTPVERSASVIVPYAAYAAARAEAAHRVVSPGDRLTLDDIAIDVVTAGGEAITSPLAGAGRPNPACASTEPGRRDATENARSVGLLVRFGAFRYADLGDLSWNEQLKLACPVSVIGRVDLFLVPHHGNGDAVVPAFLNAIDARAFVTNNSATKGASADAFARLHRLQGLADVWQLHRSIRRGVVNFSDDMIANLEDTDRQDAGHWIKATAGADGSFTVMNGRTGFSRRYEAAGSPASDGPEPRMRPLDRR